MRLWSRPTSLTAAALSLAFATAFLSAAPASSVPADSQSAPAAVSATASDGHRPGPRFGASIYKRPGQSYGDAFRQTEAKYGGHLGAARLFFPGMPPSWSWLRSVGGDTRLVVSFKAPPGQILSGRYDARLRNWFADAPRGYNTRWAYYHEPENDDERGGLDPAAYRRAWDHVAALARQADNPHLRATLILMCWTIKEKSGRDWRDYYPGSDVIDLVAFDCYNGGHVFNGYRPASQMLEHVVQFARQIGKPWAVAELGTARAGGDNGSARASWLRKAAAYAREEGARFVTYFDSGDNSAYRLNDSASTSAWRGVVSSQWN